MFTLVFACVWMCNLSLSITVILIIKYSLNVGSLNFKIVLYTVKLLFDILNNYKMNLILSNKCNVCCITCVTITLVTVIIDIWQQQTVNTVITIRDNPFIYLFFQSTLYMIFRCKSVKRTTACIRSPCLIMDHCYRRKKIYVRHCLCQCWGLTKYSRCSELCLFMA